MLILLLGYLLISFTCLWTGYYTHLLLQKILPGEETAEKNGMAYALWGLVTLTLAGQIIELFFPLNQVVWAGWVLGLCVVSLLNKKVFFQYGNWLAKTGRQNKHLVVPCCILLLFVSNLGAGPLMMDDTESYHIQAIKWIQEYGTVPGLANLHERYGFNSSWFSFAAFFIPARTAYNFYAAANGVLSLWLTVYLMSHVFPAPKLKYNTAPAKSMALLVVLLAALFCWPMIRGNATTANYDFITTCTLLVLFIELCKPAALPKQWSAFVPEMVVWPVFLFTVRIINFPVLLVSLYGCIHLLQQKKFYPLTAFIVFAIALVLPFLTRNVLLSGYIFFPVYQVDWFTVDWKADLVRTRELVRYIKYFNRINTGFMPVSASEQLGFPQWVASWFYYLSGFDKPVLVMGFLGYASCAVRYSRFRKLAVPVQVITAAMVTQLASWFVIAPDPRFVYGPLLVGIFLFFYLAPVKYLQQLYQTMARPLLFVLVTGMLAYSLLKTIRHPGYTHLLVPITIPVPPVRSIHLGQIELKIPEKMGGNWNARCYATGLPCLYEVQPGLQARGKEVKQGFKIKK